MSTRRAWMAMAAIVVLAASLSSCNGKKMQAMMPPPPVTLAPMAAPDGITGLAYAFMVQASGGTPPYTLVESTAAALFPMGQGAMGTPCQGLGLNLMTGAIAGTPVIAGTCGPFIIQATDSSIPVVTGRVTLSIRIAAPLAVSTATLPNGTDDVAYNRTVATTGGLAPLTFSISAGMLPPGLNLNTSSGVLSGTPTAGGSFNFTVQVRDSLSPQQSATRAFTVLVLEVSTTNLPNGTVNQTYAQSLAASGGVGNITWALAAGSGPLPGGLNLNAMGMISGTPNAAGTFNLTVQATDSDTPARTDTQAVSISVDNPVPTIGTLTPSGAQAGDPAFSLTVDGMDFVSGAAVQWNGSPRTTTFANSNQVTASIPASDVAAMGTASVQVNNPAPGGGLSNTLTFTISAGPNPVPTLATLQPDTATEGTAGVTLTVLGTGFVSNSEVHWNGLMRATTFMSSTQLQAAIQTADLSATGMAQVTVFNPAPGGGTSNSLPFTINPAPPSAGVLEIVSVDSSGTQGNAGSRDPAASMSGRYIAFASNADNLVAGDSPQTPDAFLRDTCQGAGAACVPSTLLLSATAGGAPTGAVILPTVAISTDARYVAFADRSVGGGLDTLVARDTCIGAPGGCTPATEVVSKADNGTMETGTQPSFGGSGQFVAFRSSSSTLVPNDTNGVPDVFLHDRDVDGNGVFDEPNTPGMADKNSTIRVSLASDGSEAAADAAMMGSSEPAVSADGRYVAFVSAADNLLGAGGDTNGNPDVFVRDTCIGAPGGCTPTTVLVSLDANLNPFNPGFPVSIGSPSMSAGGRFVAFAVPSSLNGIFVHDRDADGNGTLDEICMGCRSSVRVVTSSFATSFSSTSVSADGRLVAFVGVDFDTPSSIGAPNLHVGVHDRLFRQSFSISKTPTGGAVDNNSSNPSISGDGRLLAFDSDATNLGPTDTNGSTDVFLGSTGVDPASPRVPVITFMNPTTRTAGGAAFTLTVAGMNFEVGAVVRWNGSDRTTTFSSSTGLSAMIPASDIASAGTVQVTVFDPVCNCTSNAFTLTIN